jgi:glycosyltransferase involved in cell wall biosynthesis
VKIALVHDWLTGMRGGEKALEVMCERFPDAELFTLFHLPGSVSATIEARPIHTSFIQRLPAVTRYYRHYLPLFPTAVEGFNFDRFDIVLSTSHCAVKSVITPGRAAHLCYCLTPMRYAWDQFDAYFGPERLGRLGSRLMRPIMARLARWDRDTAGRVDRYVAISHYVAGRIGRYYNRQAAVVYPPVDTAFFHPDVTTPEGSRDRHDESRDQRPAEIQSGPPGALVVSALVPYKRLAVAIDACDMAGVPLTIVGDGPERAGLERHAKGRAAFLGRLSDEQIRDHYRRAAVVLLPGEEDFGIVPLEAQACGRPVVALGRGGARETVVHGHTGLLVDDLSTRAFADAITEVVAGSFDSAAIRRHAERFSRQRFGDEIETLVQAHSR